MNYWKSASDLHRSAMERLDESLDLQRQGRTIPARTALEDALDQEQQAARLLPADRAHEPSRSILYCSAAAIAGMLDRPDEARGLAQEGLDGDPTEDQITRLRAFLAPTPHRGKQLVDTHPKQI